MSSFMETMRPCNDHVIVRHLPEPEQTVILTANKCPRHEFGCNCGKPHYAEVVSVGPGKRGKHGGRIPLSVVPGMKVHYLSSDIEDGEFALIQEADILGIEG